MTAPALCAPPETSVAKAAKLMLKCRVNRLPVVADGTLVGIVTRADLVRAFHRSDDEIERELRGDVLEHTLWLDPAGVDVGVEDGVVTLTGVTDTRTTARLVETLARRVPGVVAVESRLEWRFDDRNVHASRSSLTP